MVKKQNRKTESHSAVNEAQRERETVPVKEISANCDETLLERSRTQWQFGDWQSLAQIDRDALSQHPQRGKLALLAAAGHQQLGNLDATREFFKLAQQWGCTKKELSQVLIAGVYNTLGRAAAVAGQEQRALEHLKVGIRLGQPGADAELLSETRLVREYAKFGLLPQATKIMASQLDDLKQCRLASQSRLSILETELELLNHELSLALKRNQLGYQQKGHQPAIEGSSEWLNQLKQKSVSQLGQDLWVLGKTDYKREGFFVEFGATDGVKLSNTFLLEKEFGWKGICAEPNPKHFHKLKNNRNCIVSNQCIGGTTGQEIEFIFADAFGGSAVYADADNHKSKREAYRKAGHTAILTSISLHDFLIQHQAPKNIDYLSIDTEGSEYEILKAFPFKEWNIRLLTVEHNFTERRKDIRKVLEGHGYQCLEAQWDDWFERSV